MKASYFRAIVGLMLFFHSAVIQAADYGRVYKFWVELQDKRGSNYSVLRPWDFLSQRALNRRVKSGVSVNMDDIPVNYKYVTEIRGMGVQIQLTSRWMNGVLVSTADSGLVVQIKSLTFVKKVSLVGSYNKKRGVSESDPELVSHSTDMSAPELNRIEIKTKVKESEYNDGYGMGWKQISMLNGQELHKSGFKGDGIFIAVLDAGFYRANRIAAFDSIFKTNRYLGSYDLVNYGDNVFNDDDHGTQVLSCMASNVNGVMVGTAPNASYLLIRTEDAGSETPAEEIQWLCGAEIADSMGVDLISSSVGYTEFDDKSFGHHYNELDGRTTIITRAANMAWDRGIIVVNSAGNEGDGSWGHIGAPADAPGVIAVGAVDEDGRKADFSSYGPTSDGRIKPDLMALGKRTTIVNTNGYYIRSNGTSYSAPVLAGVIACFIQANPKKSHTDIKKLIMLSASDYFKANNLTGSGLPDFKAALKWISKTVENDNKFPFYNLPVTDTIYSGFDLKTHIPPKHGYTYFWYNKFMDEESGTIFKHENMIYGVRLEPRNPGIYKLEIYDGKTKWVKEFYYIRED